jgi:RNA chaperone Hfq
MASVILSKKGFFCSMKNKKQENNFYEDEFSEKVFMDANCGKSVGIFLVNGIKLSGEMVNHDERSVLLINGDSRNIVYKNSISSIHIGKTSLKRGNKEVRNENIYSQ